MTTIPLTFESVARVHMAAEPERQQQGLQAWSAALTGDASTRPEDSELYTLAEVAKVVRKHPTWLHRLGVQRHAGERLGGRYMYRKSRVLAFLGSEACRERITEIRQAKNDQAAKKGVA